MPDKLAMHGGTKAVAKEIPDRWRRIRWNDILRIAKLAYRDINTTVDGGGLITEFEKRFTKLTNTKYGLTMNSGTSALHSAFLAVGVKPGTEVIVPTYTWFASATPIIQCGATPVFCDIDPQTLTADPADVEKRITPRTRAICVVHVWGNPAALDRFVEIAKRHNLALIEDASHAHGAIYQNKPVGSWGDIGCFSLQGTKAVSGGELGIAVTNNPTLYDRMLVLGHNGRTQKGQANNTYQVDNISIGLKYRPHLYGVALALGGLERLEELNTRRRSNYQVLSEALQGCEAVRPIEIYPDATRGGLLEFILRFDPKHAGGWNREAFCKAAAAEGVPIRPDRYTKTGPTARLLHESPVFTTMDYSEFGGCVGVGMRDIKTDSATLPAANRLADQLMTMPPFTLVPESYIRDCARGLRKVVDHAAGSKNA